MRHVLYVDPAGAFVMTAITWLPGQVSPVHGHQVWCAYGVAEGELTEEQFRETNGTLSLAENQRLPAGRNRRARLRLQGDPPRVEPQPRHDRLAAPLRRVGRAADHRHQPALPLAAARGAHEFQGRPEHVEVLLVVGGIGAVDLDPLPGARHAPWVETGPRRPSRTAARWRRWPAGAALRPRR